MHSAEREKLILETVNQRGFISFQDLERRIAASPATIRRDLERMMVAGLLKNNESHSKDARMRKNEE